MDSEIVKRAKKGDEGAMRQLYEMSFDSLYRYVRFKVNTDEVAEDIVAEAFTRSFETINKFRGQCCFKTYVYSIARNLLKEFYLHKTKEINIESIENIEEEQISDNGESKINLRINNIKSLFIDLTKTEVDVIEARYLSGLNVAECSKLLALSESNVKVITHRTITKLKKMLNINNG